MNNSMDKWIFSRTNKQFYECMNNSMSHVYAIFQHVRQQINNSILYAKKIVIFVKELSFEVAPRGPERWISRVWFDNKANQQDSIQHDSIDGPTFYQGRQVWNPKIK